MKARLSELHSMVAQLEVAVAQGEEEETETEIDGTRYRCMKRLHSFDGEPFCVVEIRLNTQVYEQAPKRFSREIVVSVLQDIGIDIASARQRVTISYADFEIAGTLGIPVNSAVFSVIREFFDSAGRLVYSANLIYPGDRLSFDIEFSVGEVS